MAERTVPLGNLASPLPTHLKRRHRNWNIWASEYAKRAQFIGVDCYTEVRHVVIVAILPAETKDKMAPFCPVVDHRFLAGMGPANPRVVLSFAATSSESQCGESITAINDKDYRHPLTADPWDSNKSRFWDGSIGSSHCNLIFPAAYDDEWHHAVIGTTFKGRVITHRQLPFFSAQREERYREALQQHLFTSRAYPPANPRPGYRIGLQGSKVSPAIPCSGGFRDIVLSRHGTMLQVDVVPLDLENCSNPQEVEDRAHAALTEASRKMRSIAKGIAPEGWDFADGPLSGGAGTV